MEGENFEKKKEEGKEKLPIFQEVRDFDALYTILRMREQWVSHSGIYMSEKIIRNIKSVRATRQNVKSIEEMKSLLKYIPNSGELEGLRSAVHALIEQGHGGTARIE
ncbi:MAG: hypothetical protein AAB864_00060 [Patescibacteria group bacterium]